MCGKLVGRTRIGFERGRDAEALRDAASRRGSVTKLPGSELADAAAAVDLTEQRIGWPVGPRTGVRVAGLMRTVGTVLEERHRGRIRRQRADDHAGAGAPASLSSIVL